MHSIECKLTPATRSPVIWPNIKWVAIDSWCTLHVASLVIVVSAVLFLSCRQTDTQNRRGWTLYSRDSDVSNKITGFYHRSIIYEIVLNNQLSGYVGIFNFELSSEVSNTEILINICINFS